MRGDPNGKPTKLTKMVYNRLSLCRNPADQDAKIVLVKSADDEEEVVDNKDVDTQKPKEELPVSAELQKAIDTAVAAALEKATNHPALTTLAGGQIPDTQPADDGGKTAVKEQVVSLVKACNSSKITPKAIKTQVAALAKFHGVDGPEITDDGTSEQFQEAIASINAIASTLQQTVVKVASMQQQASKPAPAKKAIGDDGLTAELVKSVETATIETRKLINQIRKDSGKEPI